MYVGTRHACVCIFLHECMLCHHKYSSSLRPSSFRINTQNKHVHKMLNARQTENVDFDIALRTMTFELKLK